MILKTPPMGWNSWNTFGKDIDEKVVMETADAMVESGLKDAGYEYVVIDDIWSLHERDESGHLVPNPEKFPHGMKYVADYVHSKGLKFGMYSSAGYLTCAGYPASYEYEWIDAKTFAEWGVDYLKYDFCSHPVNVAPDVMYKRMGIALANCGRDIVFSACSWGYEHTRQWIKETGAHLWRSTGDICDAWWSIKKLGQSQIQYQEYNGQGCFNDMDMLIVGMNGKGNVAVGGCTYEEYKFHFSLWALLNSPLMIGCDIRNMTDEAKQILSNKDVIAINQDPAARQPFFINPRKLTINENRGSNDPFYKDLPVDTPIIAKFLDGGDIAIGIFNFKDDPDWMEFHLEALGLPVISKKTVEMTDLWTGEVLKPSNAVFDFGKFEGHSCRLFRAKVVDVK